MKGLKLNKQGFTIVELLIVVVVIAILAAITIVAYNGVTSKANEAAVVSTTNSLEKKFAVHLAETGSYGRRDVTQSLYGREGFLDEYDLAELSDKVMICSDVSAGYDECLQTGPWDRAKVYLAYDSYEVSISSWSNSDNEWKNVWHQTWEGKNTTEKYSTPSEDGPFGMGYSETFPL